jgi:hypothetical protein
MGIKANRHHVGVLFHRLNSLRISPIRDPIIGDINASQEARARAWLKIMERKLKGDLPADAGTGAGYQHSLLRQPASGLCHRTSLQ